MRNHLSSPAHAPARTRMPRRVGAKPRYVYGRATSSTRMSACRSLDRSGKLAQASTFRSPFSTGADCVQDLAGCELDWSRVPARSAHARLSAFDVPTAAAGRASTAWVWATAAQMPAVAWPSPWPSSLCASAASSSARRKCSGPVIGAPSGQAEDGHCCVSYRRFLAKIWPVSMRLILSPSSWNRQ